LIGTHKPESKAPFYTKSWQIDQDTYEFGLCEVSHLKEKLPRQ